MNSEELEAVCREVWRSLPWDECGWDALDPMMRSIVRSVFLLGYNSGRASVLGVLPPEGPNDEE